MQGTVVHDFDGGRVGVGVVDAELLNEAAIALGAGVGSDEVVEGFSFLTVTLESEAYSHGKNVLEGSETQLLEPKLERKDSQSLHECATQAKNQPSMCCRNSARTSGAVSNRPP